MIYDFSFEQVMRLSAVRRWGIVEMSRPQSVAEHSYNVAVIAGALADMMGLSFESKATVVMWGLAHDLPEVVTGDLPTTIKAHMPDAIAQLEQKLFPIYINRKDSLTLEQTAVVKAADWIDAIQFAKKFCVDSRANEIINEMLLKLHHHCKLYELVHPGFSNAVDKIWQS